MDPDEALKSLREWAETLEALEDLGDATRAKELFQALDKWLSKGGFLPADWDEQVKRAE